MSEELLPTIDEVESKVLEKLDLDDRSELSSTVRENLKAIILGLIEVAKGVQIQEIKYDKNGDEIEGPVYRKAPSETAAQYLINQLIGRPKETQVSVGITNNIVVQNEIKFNRYAKSPAERQ